MNLAEEFRDLLGCCLHDPTWQPDEVTEVLLAIEDSPEGYGSTDQLVIARLRDGWGLLTSCVLGTAAEAETPA